MIMVIAMIDSYGDKNNNKKRKLKLKNNKKSKREKN